MLENIQAAKNTLDLLEARVSWSEALQVVVWWYICQTCEWLCASLRRSWRWCYHICKSGSSSIEYIHNYICFILKNSKASVCSNSISGVLAHTYVFMTGIAGWYNSSWPGNFGNGFQLFDTFWNNWSFEPAVYKHLKNWCTGMAAKRRIPGS